MKIAKLAMEDWLADYQYTTYNLAESGFVDFNLGDFLDRCNEDPSALTKIDLINPDTMGSIELRQQIAACYENVAPENVLVTVGVTEALFTFFNTLLEPGDEVIVPFPQFQTLKELPAAIGCTIKYLNLTIENKFTPDAVEIEKLITPKTRLIIINNPHNPSGSVLANEAVIRICELARRHNIWLLFDEHYKFLPLTPGSHSLLSGYDLCKDFYDNVAATGSVTKCFGLNGLRVGWLIAQPGILDQCREFKHYLTHVTPPINDYLAALALKNKDVIIPYVKETILTNLEKLNAFMAKHHDVFDYIEPGGGLVCFPRLKGQSDARVFCRQVLDKYGISLLPGSAFDMNAHFRINFGVPVKIFRKALELLGSHLKETLPPDAHRPVNQTMAQTITLSNE